MSETTETPSVGVVYAVRDEDGTVRYVGQTTVPVGDRWRQHLRDSRAPRAPFHRWLRDRLEAGHVPCVEVIERVPVAALGDREQHWIRHHQATSTNVQQREPGDRIEVSGAILSAADVARIIAERDAAIAELEMLRLLISEQASQARAQAWHLEDIARGVVASAEARDAACVDAPERSYSLLDEECFRDPTKTLPETVAPAVPNGRQDGIGGLS